MAPPAVELAIKSKIIRLPDGGRDTSTTVLRVVGGDVMYLQGVYHPDQLWLDHLGPIIHHVEDRPVKVGPMPSEETARRLKNRESKWASIEPEARQLYIPEKGVEQLVLPFPEGREIRTKVWERLARNNWPCFDRDPTTRQPYKMTWIREEVAGAEKELITELHARCQHRFYVKRHGSGRTNPAKFGIHFESYRDFVEMKLLA